MPAAGGKTLPKLDGGVAAVLADAGVSIRAPGPATTGPSSSTVFAFPVVEARSTRNSQAAVIATTRG
jgi:hypothetical protein